MCRSAFLLVPIVFAGCVMRQEGPERWFTRNQGPNHYKYSELAPERRAREVTEAVRLEAVASLSRAPFRRLSEAEFKHYGGSSLELLPFQSAYLLRAIRPVGRAYRLELYRDHVEHRGHTEPPATVSTVLRTEGLGSDSLEKTAVLYVDSRPPERLNVVQLP